MLRSWYDWVIRMSEHPKALWVLAGIAFAESSFFPIPPDIMVLLMVIAQPKRAWLIAGVCTAASVVGGFFGYAIGYYFYETVGKSLIEFYHLQERFASLRHDFDEYGVWVILFKGLTPIPYKIVTIASGVFHFDLMKFGIASLITRGGRFFLVAAILYVAGPSARVFVEKHLPMVLAAFAAIVVLGLVAVAYI